MAGNLKTKEHVERNVEFAKGGNDHMFGQQMAEPQTPAQTASKDKAGPGAKYAEGGKTKMFGFHGSVPATAGQTGAR